MASMRLVPGFHAVSPFEAVAPGEQRVPFVFNSPHSGAAYPETFVAASRLDPPTLRRSEDAFVDELFASCVAAGAPLLRAHFPRAFLDVNREPYELDPKMFSARLPPYANSRSLRVAGGLGTIARVVAEQEEIYAGPLDLSEALDRIERIYKPYHEKLRRLVAATHAQFGFAVLVDCHSMPSIMRGADQRTRPDIVLGDRYGASCHPFLIECAAAILQGLGYIVALNKPYAGGFITEHYGRPGSGLHALQIEVNRALYMDERRHERSAGFDRLRADLDVFVRRLVQVPGADFLPLAEAAE